MTSPDWAAPQWPAPGGPLPAQPLPPQQEPQNPKTSGFAIAALVLGILGVVLLSVIFGIVGLVQTKGGKRKGRGIAIAGLAISLVWIVAAVAVVAVVIHKDRGTVSTQDLAVGNCIKEFPSADTTTLARTTVIPCEQPHIGEVFAVVNLPDSSTYPGTDEMKKHNDDCDPKLEPYAPNLPDGLNYDLYFLYPSAETWRTGDRSLVCIFSTDQLRTGSIH